MVVPLQAIAVALGSLLVSSASAASFTESIDSSWATRWTHSSEEKYNGKFVAEAPPGSQDVGLKVINEFRSVLAMFNRQPLILVLAPLHLCTNYSSFWQRS